MNDMAADAIGAAAQFSPLNTSLLAVAIGMLGLLLRYQIAARKLRLEEEVGDRAGWREVIDALREQVTQLSTQVTELQGENTALRKEIRELHGVIDGMRRDNLQKGNSAALAVANALPEGSVPPSTLASIKRIAGEGK